MNTVAALQESLLASLGVARRGYAPYLYVGKGQVMFASLALQDRFRMAGFQDCAFKSWMSGAVAMNTRTIFRLVNAAAGQRCEEGGVHLEILVEST